MPRGTEGEDEVTEQEYAARQKARTESRRCPHCLSLEPYVACQKCNRDMCEECISIWPSYGKVCGLCYDRMEGRGRFDRLASPSPADFDEWYDKNG
jgi:hypothetical protein